MSNIRDALRLLAYQDAQTQARTLLAEITRHVDEHADAVARYPGNLSPAHVQYIDEVSAMLRTILWYVQGGQEPESD
jgi:hypothetical protein